MTIIGYIAVGILMILDVIGMAICEIINKEQFKNILEGLLFVLVLIIICASPV